jgi:hypothetical protein
MKSGGRETTVDMHELPKPGDDLNFNIGGVFVVDRIEHEFYNASQSGAPLKQRRSIIHATEKP